MFMVSASPTQAFADAMAARLDGDATLMALVEGNYGHLSERQRTVYPYNQIGDKTLDQGDTRSMGLAGGRVEIQLHTWSDHKGDSEVLAIQSRNRALLERETLTLAGFVMVRGSLHCEAEMVFFDEDVDKPQNSLYHGVQRWVAEIDEAV